MKNILSSAYLIFTTTFLYAQSHINFEIRYTHNPLDFKGYDTEKIRDEFLMTKVFQADKINIMYTMYDRLIIGGAMPMNDQLQLNTLDILKAPNFLHRRELGIINIGGPGIVRVGEKKYNVGTKEALYVGKGEHEIVFLSVDPKEPAKFYFNSAPAHTSYPTKLITEKDANIIDAGSKEESNKRRIVQLIVRETVDVCQVQMGLTELAPGSVWNTMPAHVHNRRMEAYLYFQLPDKQSVCHYLGEPKETRHIWLQNEQVVLSPEWSIHSGSGTSNYSFIWGMAGENLDYADMEVLSPHELR